MKTNIKEATRDLQSCIAEFQKKFGFYCNQTPGFMHTTLRKDLIVEECEELVRAVEGNDLVEAADALCDIIYVVMGAAVTWGIDLGPLMEEVHQSNMAKEGGGFKNNGKVKKPVGWQPPRIKELLEEQGYHETP